MKTQLFKHGFLYIIILLVISITFFGCNSDEPDEGVNESGLVGSWVWDTYHGSDTAYLEEIITFKSNSTGIYDENWYPTSGEVETETYKFT